MAIDLTNGTNGYKELMEHRGHKIVCVSYGSVDGEPVAVALECETCNCVLVDFDRD